jgi:hypothetical protein
VDTGKIDGASVSVEPWAGPTVTTNATAAGRQENHHRVEIAVRTQQPGKSTDCPPAKRPF